MTQKIEGSWQNRIVDSDLQAERDKCDFDQNEAMLFLLDAEYAKQIQDTNWMFQDPEITNTHHFHEMSR